MDKKELLKYVVAFCYGDGGVYYHGNNCRFEATVTEDHEDYAEWRKDILEDVTNVNLYTITENREGRKNILKTTTYTHPLYTKVRNRLYHYKHKVFDTHYLKLFDWESLAILFMDDGSNVATHRYYKDKHYKCTPVVTLATLSHDYANNWLLKKTIKNKLNLEFNVRKHSSSKTGIKWYLILRSTSYDRFIKGVKDYILTSFEYKLYPYGKPSE